MFGYTHRMYTCASDAARAAFRSRDAFLPYIGIAAGLIAILREYARSKAWDEDFLIREIIKHKLMPDVFISNVRECEIGRQSAKRVGVVVRLHDCEFLPKMPAFVNANVPV